MSEKQPITGQARGALPFAPEGWAFMIRFGSRVNCEIPADFELNVKVGDHATAGETIIARKVQ